MRSTTFALFYLDDIAKFNKLLAHTLHISGFILVSKNLTNTSIPFKLMIWYLHCSSNVKFPNIFSTYKAIVSSLVFKLSFILSGIPGINLIAEIWFTSPEETLRASNTCF